MHTETKSSRHVAPLLIEMVGLFLFIMKQGRFKCMTRLDNPSLLTSYMLLIVILYWYKQHDMQKK